MSPMPPPPPLIEDPVRIEICGSADDLFRHAATLIASLAGRALGARSHFRLALSGDETLWPLWELLPQPHYAYQIVWPAVSVYRLDDGGQERLEALRARLGIPAENFHARPEAGDPRCDFAIVAMDRDGGIARLGVPIDTLNSAGAVCVVVTGEACAAAARRVLGAGARPEGLPAQRLRPASGRLIWLLDQAAASELGSI